MKHRCTFVWLAVGALGCSDRAQPPPAASVRPTAVALAVSTSAPPSAAPGVALSLQILNVRVELSDAVIHPEGGASRPVQGVMFSVEARLDNGGPSTTMLTNFSSIFDGFELVVETTDGKELERVNYTFHQSPYAMDRPLPLPAGPSTTTLVFPIAEWTQSATELRLRLEGGLRGTPWPSGVKSNELVVTIPSRTP